MGAFYSGTDDANENMTQFYGVWGKIKNDKPEFVFRYVNGKTRQAVPLTVLFDLPTIKTTKTVETKVTHEFTHAEGFDLTEVVGTNTVDLKSEIKEEVYAGPWPRMEYPEDWMGQHSKRTYTYGAGTTYNRSATGKTPSKYGYGSAYGGGYGGGYGTSYDDYDDGYYGGYGGYYGYGQKSKQQELFDKEGYAKTSKEGDSLGKPIRLARSEVDVTFLNDEDDNIRNREVLKDYLQELEDIGMEDIIYDLESYSKSDFEAYVNETMGLDE